MKKVLLFILMTTMLGANIVFAQLRSVPSEVTNALKEKFPKASDVSWKDNLTNWQAKFKDDSIKTSVYFTSKGEWKETDKELKYDDLPAVVKDGFKKSKYNDWTPGSVLSIEKKDKALQYRVYAEKSSLVQKVYLYFDEKGALVKDAPGI
jgi:hypothetical protein